MSDTNRVEIADLDTLQNASVTQRGSKGAVAVEILDSNGNQLTSLGQIGRAHV